MNFKARLTILLLAALYSAELNKPEYSALCDICKKTQTYFLNFSQEHLNSALSAASLVCQIKSSKHLCDYFVKNFGFAIFNNKKQFLETTNFFCSNVLKLCTSGFNPYSVEDFRKKISDSFPKNSLNAKSILRRGRSGKPFKALVLNDIHLQTDYQFKAPAQCGLPGGCCSSSQGIADDPSNQAKYWGTPQAPCDAPDYLFYNTVNYIKENLEKPDLIFMLGDNTGHNYFIVDEQVLVNSTKIIIDTLKGNFTDVPIIPVLGNHECHHVDYFDFSDKSNFVIEKIYPLFQTLVAKEKIDDLINNGFFSQEFPEFNLKVISLNSQINDAFNVANIASSPFFQDFLFKLAANFYESEKKGQKVIVLSHIALTDYFAIEEINKSLIVILERFKDTFITVLSGHTHSDQIRFIRDSQGDIFQANFVSPSLTTFSSYNPSFRIYDFNDGIVDDYTQYKFDIDFYNAKADAGIFDFKYEVAYTFKNEYGIVEWNKDQMKIFYQRLIDRDPVIISKYVRNYYCLNEISDIGEKVETVMCEISDDLDVIMACMNELTDGQAQTEFVTLFRKLFVRSILVPNGQNV